MRFDHAYALTFDEPPVSAAKHFNEDGVYFNCLSNTSLLCEKKRLDRTTGSKTTIWGDPVARVERSRFESDRAAYEHALSVKNHPGEVTEHKRFSKGSRRKFGLHFLSSDLHFQSHRFRYL